MFQIPWLAFSLCKAARFGPWLPGVEAFLMPAPALAVDQRLPKASPLLEDLGERGLEEALGLDERVGRAALVAFDCDGVGAGTEVK